MNTGKRPYRLTGPTLFIGLFVLSLLCGCQHGLDPVLTLADSKLEEHPDSAMALLDGYRLSPQSTSADSAYYALLLTHARYKNFIDKTNDSLISVSADYFLDHGDEEKAARALFLKGMIQMNDRRLGEASVSFRKGLDIAHEGKHYMWEGQCARGLYIILGELKNPSGQIKYAWASYNAFHNGNFTDWSNFARLNILRAYHNSGHNKKALIGAEDLLSIAKESKDTTLIAEILTLMGTCRYSIEDYKGALESYIAAYRIDTTILEQEHRFNIKVALANVNKDSLSPDVGKVIYKIFSCSERFPLFKELADSGRFVEAYHALEDYKNLQDSVLKVIMQNDVAEILNQYDTTEDMLRRERLKSERLTGSIIILLLLTIILFSFRVYKNQRYKQERAHEQLNATLDLLRMDISRLMSSNEEMMVCNREIWEKNARMSSYLRNFLKEKYKKVNELCDSYFQDRVIASKKVRFENEIELIIKDFSNCDFLQEAATHIDQCYDNLYSHLIQDFPNLKEDARRLFIFLSLGLSTRTICVIFNIESANLYNRKARLKRIIAESESERKKEYLNIITK